MTTFSFSTGNPSNLTGGATASMTDISGSLSDIKTFINGGSITDTNVTAAGLTDTSLASPTNAVWRSVLSCAGAASSSGTLLSTTPAWFSTAGGTFTSGSGATSGPQGIWTPAAAGDVAVAGKTARLRLRVNYMINATAPGITITWGIYPITGVAGTAGNISITLGTVIAGSTVSVASPAGSGGNILTGTTFDFSAVTGATNYILGVVGSGAQAANSCVSSNVLLEMRHT